MGPAQRPSRWQNDTGGSIILLSHDSSLLGQIPLLHCAQRMFASQTEGELKVTQILKENFPQATTIKVTDISGKLFFHLTECGRILPSGRAEDWGGGSLAEGI